MKNHRIVPGLAAAALLALGLSYSDVAGARFGTGAGEAAKGGKPSGWEIRRSVDEATLHLRVRLALLEHLKTEALPIEVDVHTREVVLRGTVKERATIDTAVDVAERVDGVGKVVNRLEPPRRRSLWRRPWRGTSRRSNGFSPTRSSKGG